MSLYAAERIIYMSQLLENDYSFSGDWYLAMAVLLGERAPA